MNASDVESYDLKVDMEEAEWNFFFLGLTFKYLTLNLSWLLSSANVEEIKLQWPSTKWLYLVAQWFFKIWEVLRSAFFFL